MVNTVLFDVDGTLLPLDMDRFMHLYMSSIRAHFAGTFDGDRLEKVLWTGTGAMAKNDGTRTNEQVFWSLAMQMMPEIRPEHLPDFIEYYKTGFTRVCDATRKNPAIAQCIQRLKDRGFTLVAATNPFFPQVATRNRLVWAGLDPDDFALITTYEDSHYCKPDIRYYEEILARIGKAPEECIMVGNDNQEDMIAESLGMKGYLITDCLINRDDAPITCHWTGTFDQFLEKVEAGEIA